jgi:hypothetical protein
MLVMMSRACASIMVESVGSGKVRPARTRAHSSSQERVDLVSGSGTRGCLLAPPHARCSQVQRELDATVRKRRCRRRPWNEVARGLPRF